MPLRAIYLGTFSKTLYPELRMGYRVLLPTLVPVAGRKKKPSGKPQQRASSCWA